MIEPQLTSESEASFGLLPESKLVLLNVLEQTRLCLSHSVGDIVFWEVDLVKNTRIFSCNDIHQSAAQKNQSWNAALSLVHPEDRQLLIEATQAHFNHGTKYDVEYRALTPAGDLRWMRSAGQAKRDADGKPVLMRGIVQDVTERHENQQRIEHLVDEQRTILENRLVGIATVRDRRIIWANFAFETLFGYGKGELIGATPRQLYVDENDYQAVGAAYANIGNDEIVRNQQEFVRKDGRHIWVDMRGTLLNKDAGETLWVFVDVTERKLAEQNQNRLARALKLLGKSNSLLVRAANEQELLTEVCQLAVETGGYLMAWVGYANNDPEQTVHPIAQFGYEDGYLGSIHITWADKIHGHGPTGTAIRTGVTVAVQDFQSDPKMALWREIAIRRGYQASIALPLIVNKQILGALTIYSTEPFAFGKEEVILLEELANDLAFGIETLRTRIEHATTQLALQKESEKNLALLRNASDGIHILDADGTVIEASDSFCAMLGYRRDEMIGMNVSRWDAKLSASELPGALAQQFSQHVRSQFETRHRRKDGSVFDVEVSGFPLELDGKPVLFNSSRDITERKLHESHITENEQRLLDILNASPIAVRIATKNGREVVFYNQSYADLIKNINAIGDDPKRFYVRADDYEEVLAELARGHSVINRQIELNIPDGSTVWALATYMPMRYQGEDAVLGWFYDITERRQAEIALQESEEKLQAILNASEVAVAWANEKGEIEYVNPKFTSLFGYTLGDVPTIEQWYLHAYPDAAYRTKVVGEWNTKVARSIIRKTAIESMETKVSCKEGSIRHVIIMGSWAGNRLLANFSDITERKLAEELLFKQKQFSDDVINSLPGIFYMLNQQGCIVRVNRPFQEVSGFSSEELAGISALNFFDEQDRNAVAQKMQEAFESGDSWVEAEFITRSGQKIPYAFSGHRTHIDDQYYVVGLGTDISERKRLSHQLDEREELFGAIFNRSPLGIELIDPETLRFVEVNPAACRMLGYTHEEFLGLRLVDTQAAGDEEMLAAAVKQVEAADGATFENRHRTKQGEILDVEVNARMLNFSGRRLLIGIWHDITERKRAEEGLRITASVFENTQEAIMITDANNAIIDVNSAFIQITGFSRDEVIGQDPKILSLDQQSKDFYVKMWRSIQQTGTWRGEIWNRRKSGEVYAGMLSISAILNNEGKAQRYVGVFSDISHIKKHEAELKHIAHFDALTGIPNRALLADRMKQAIAQTSRERNMLAVCYLDLDGFKPINDTMGHDAGDQVLIEVAKRIGSTIRGGDTVARLGGDEFVILLLGIEKGEECMATLERLLAAISQPISVKNKFQSISASIGVSLYPLDNEDPDTLLRHADQAMYVAKQSGKNRFHIYDPALDMRVRDHHDFLKSISYGLKHKQFELYYQPKVNLRTKELAGAEALIRWRHPERGLLAPGEFLRSIENTDLDIELGNWVIATALAQTSRWRQTGLNIEVSINISAYHLESDRFAERLGQQLAHYPDLPSGTLQIEVLETAALNDIGIVREVIDGCRMLGVGFALDDFGTGYSSLSYLSNLPVDVLKIDQSFVRDMLEDKGDLAIVQGIIALARAFDRQTVAEGIETDEQYRVLLDMGCELGQGYGIARPMPADELTSWQGY